MKLSFKASVLGIPVILIVVCITSILGFVLWEVDRMINVGAHSKITLHSFKERYQQNFYCM